MLTTWSSSFGLCGAPGMFPPLSSTPTNLIHTTRPPISRTDPATSCHITRFVNGSPVHPPRHPFPERIPRPPPTSPVSRMDPASTHQRTRFPNGSHVHPPRHLSPPSKNHPATSPPAADDLSAPCHRQRRPPRHRNKRHVTRTEASWRIGGSEEEGKREREAPGGKKKPARRCVPYTPAR